PALSATQAVGVVVAKVNVAPVLAAMGNKTVVEGTLLTFTVSGTDSDLPPQSLSFTLDPGAPVGAIMIPATGVFTWTPTESQGPSTNVITVRVTDNGVPPANASETITVVVNEVNNVPVLSAIGNKAVNEEALVTFTAQASDSDLPVQTLTFSLDPGAPAG